ncbi:MAG: response regulator [Candidatus Sumerlaeaceae bacterium]|nr:response regulator [Candidatus Sumerlaeaceae bacterium]
MSADSIRVMVVDDDRDILDLVQISLSSQYEVLALTDPAQALEIFEVFDPDLAILDIMMPKITGYQILETIRKNPKYSHLPIVFLSAKESTLDIKYGYKLGANLYVPKPFQPDRLLKNVSSLLVNVHPRHREYSMRDVQLRMQLKASGVATGPAEPPSDVEGAPPKPSSSARLRRPLAQEKAENEKKKWVG